MVDTTGILSVCDPVHMVLIKKDPSGETTIVTSHFLEWRPVMSAPNSRCTMTIELMGVGMLCTLLILKQNVTQLFFSTCNDIFLSLECMIARTDTNTKSTMINLLAPLSW